MQQRVYYTVREVTELICNEHVLILTALDDVLALLPTGYWIGGISDKFPIEYDPDGEPLCIQVNDLTEWVRSVHINSYQSFNFESIERDTYPNGFSIIAIPAFSSVHLGYGVYMTTVPLQGETPIIGWVAGSECGKDEMRESVVVDGSTGEFYPVRWCSTVRSMTTLRHGLTSLIRSNPIWRKCILSSPCLALMSTVARSSRHTTLLRNRAGVFWRTISRPSIRSTSANI